jgi:hypothetical protein
LQDDLSYGCVCPTGYWGAFCEFTTCTTLFCVNGGTCTNERGGESCACAPGFAGKQCDMDASQASSSSSSGSAALYGGVGGGAFAGVCIVIAIIYLVTRRRRNGDSSEPKRDMRTNTYQSTRGIGTMLYNAETETIIPVNNPEYFEIPEENPNAMAPYLIPSKTNLDFDHDFVCNSYAVACPS